MRIGIFTDAYKPAISGLTISVETLVTELKKLGHDVFVISFYQEGQQQEEGLITFEGIHFPWKGLKEYKFTKVTKKKVKQLKDLNLDVVHSNSEFTIGRLGRKLAKACNIPYVHTYHTMYEDYCHFVTKIFERPLIYISKVYSKSYAKSADELVFPTQKVQKVFDRYGLEKEAHIIPTGVYLERFKRTDETALKAKAIREKLNLSESDFVLIYLGRMSSEKSIINLLKQFKCVVEKLPDIKLLLVGGGPELGKFQEYAAKNNLLESTRFAGMVKPEDVPVYYQVGNVFVNFSVTETQGLTYYEALASQLPLVVKYDYNLEGIVINEENGLLFNEDNEFPGLIEILYEDRKLLKNIKNNTLHSVEPFSAENFAKNIVEVYKEAIKKGE